MDNNAKSLETEQLRYRQWLTAMEMWEKKIKEQYSQLDPMLQNFTMAEQARESEMGYIIH